MKKKIAIFVYTIILANVLYSQDIIKNNYFLKKVEFGTSITLLPNALNNNRTYIGKEWTWNINGAISISKYLNVGVQSLFIFKNYITNEKEYKRYNINGFFTQINVINKPIARLFGEISINRGDYFWPGYGNTQEEPYRVKGLNYLGYGGGLVMPFTKDMRFSLEFGICMYKTLNDIIAKGNYRQYIIGINYIIGKIN